MHAREYPSTIHTAVFVHNSIGGYALGGWKSGYSRQTESSEDQTALKKRTRKKWRDGAVLKLPNLPICLSIYALLSLSLSLALTRTNTTEHDYLEIWAKSRQNGTVCFH